MPDLQEEKLRNLAFRLLVNSALGTDKILLLYAFLSLLSGSLEVHLRIKDNARGEPFFLLFGNTCT